ncbi:MAG: hypothetical protein A2X46_16040 [Lentisphaerae bacterium GWF2_57_35]|nr:MAG: hypothetical protein A2X46_16040 [Lentisphaerae bacterium GWF2_57_35]
MNNCTTKFLSIVLTGRNDNHNGDFNRRAEFAIKHNAALLKAHEVDAEWVWVEWNPLAGAPLFAETIREWVSPLRAYVVPAALHRHFCDNPHVGVVQFFAKNVGIRRAHGEWILSMNADTYLTEEVVRSLARENLRKDVLHLAIRIDFDSRHLVETPSSFPVTGLEQRTIVRTSEIRLPNAYGSAGDFTLMHRDLFMRTQGHYEGIRFSNNHLDTLLGRQVQALGGSFRILGQVFHADHADSWNNFTVEDVFAHHHGADYNSLKIPVPYRNPEDWGLANYPEQPLREDVWEIGIPAGTAIRNELPATLLIPPELKGVAEASRRLAEAIGDLRRRPLRVVIFGLGEQLRQSILKGVLSGIEVLGYIDENRGEDLTLPCRKLSWEELKAIEYDVVLLGSFYWAEELREKALRHVAEERILPTRK